MDIDDRHIGARAREIRVWRGMSQAALAQLAGIGPTYLSYIERGLRPVTKRVILEALATGLRVAPTELSDQYVWTDDPLTSEAHAVLTEVEAALTDFDLGNPMADARQRPWPELIAELDILNNKLRPEADYTAQGKLVPGLLHGLNTAYGQDAAHRRDSMVALIQVLHTSAVLTKNMGLRGVPVVAAVHAQAIAEELADPAWLGLAAWLRGHAAGSAGRDRQRALSVAAADRLTRYLDDPDAAQMYGMLHLNAAMAAAARADADTTYTHLAEAEEIAGRLDADVGQFGNLYFGRPNVGIWQVALATELGEGGRVTEIARGVRPEAVPSKARQGMFFADWGRSLARERRTREKGLKLILKAEKIAPLRVRKDVFIRETVSDLLRCALREAGGRELRGLAHRVGVAPVG